MLQSTLQKIRRLISYDQLINYDLGGNGHLDNLFTIASSKIEVSGDLVDGISRKPWDEYTYWSGWKTITRATSK